MTQKTDADRKTRVHTNSPSEFSVYNSDYINIFSHGRSSMSSKLKQKQLLHSIYGKQIIINLINQMLFIYYQYRLIFDHFSQAQDKNRFYA